MMSSKSRLLSTLGLRYPLIVAPMAGGPSSPELVAAASNAGVLGSIGAAYMTPDAILEFTNRVREQSAAPIGINLFLPSKIAEVSAEKIERAIQKTKTFRDELGLPSPKLRPPYEEDFDRQFEAVVRLRPKVFSFIFGRLDREHINEARRAEILVVGTATSPDEAMMLQEDGVDAIVVQGSEAGGHQGLFDSSSEPSFKMLELVKEVSGKIKIPLIAAGGIMTKEQIQHALRTGADAVQMGTAFLAVKEAGTSAPYRKKLLESSNRNTRLTRAFSGRLARGIGNRFMEEMDQDPEAILPFPAQNKFTRDLRNTSATLGKSDFLSLWSGAGAGDLWTGSTQELVRQLFEG